MAEVTELTPYELFGKTIRPLRHRTGLTQAAMAKEIGIGCHAYSGYELGYSVPESRLEMERLLSALDATEYEAIAIGELWVTIQSRIKMGYNDRRVPKGKIPRPVTLDKEYREGQMVVDAIRAEGDDEGHKVVCAMLNAQGRITAQGVEWMRRHKNRIPARHCVHL